MTRLIWKIVLLVAIPHSILCTCEPSVNQGTRQSRSLSDIIQRKVDSDRVILKSENGSKEDSSVYNGRETGIDESKRDSKRYGDQDTARKEYDKGRQSLGESESVDHEKNSFAHHGDGYYKKGHHRTGFSNSYHKDEAGNNSSFYEDSDSERGHRSSENNGGYYGQKSQNSFKDGLRDASYTERDRAQQGMHDNRENRNNYRGYFGGRDDNRYNGGERNYLRDGASRYHDRYGDDIFYRNEPYHRSPYRANDRMPSHGYSRYYVDTLPRDYYKEDTYDAPYSRDYRNSPSREEYYGRQFRYPDQEYYDRGFRDDLFQTDYDNKNRKGFKFLDGYRRY